MDCDQTLFFAHAHAQGRLTFWRSVMITRHLHECPHCQGDYNRQIAYRAVITTKCQEQAPAHLEARIYEAIASPISLDPENPW